MPDGANHSVSLVVLKACVSKLFVFNYTVAVLCGSFLFGTACQLLRLSTL